MIHARKHRSLDHAYDLTIRVKRYPTAAAHGPARSQAEEQSADHQRHVQRAARRLAVARSLMGCGGSFGSMCKKPPQMNLGRSEGNTTQSISSSSTAMPVMMVMVVAMPPPMVVVVPMMVVPPMSMATVMVMVAVAPTSLHRC